MKNKASIYVVIVLVLFIASVKLYTIYQSKQIESEEEVQTFDSKILKDCSWLIGFWSNESDNPRLQSHEIWWINEEGNLEGKEFYVKLYYDTTKSTQHFIMPNDKGEYEHIVITQEDEKAIFKLTAQAQDSMKFENPAHKWPQTIVYKKITTDSMVITLDGFVFENQRTLDFKMSRYNPNESSKYKRPEKN
ncbi:MAG: hypothetical protein ACLGGV_00930 [Bacteroidia bacterium]